MKTILKMFGALAAFAPAVFALAVLAAFAPLAQADGYEKLHERDYQQILCANSEHEPGAKFEMEYRLPDKSRVDCLITRKNLVGGIERVAVEVDFAHNTKPYECVGQAMFYAEQTDAQTAVCLLILRGDADNIARAVNRARVAGKRGGVLVWCIDDDISRYESGDLSLFGCPKRE